MFDDDEGSRDWEMKDEEAPEPLRKKWEQEEAKGPQTVVCPTCKRETSSENLTCLFCGSALYYKNKGEQCRPNYPSGKEMQSLGSTAILQESCPFRCFFMWVKRLFKKG